MISRLLLLSCLTSATMHAALPAMANIGNHSLTESTTSSAAGCASACQSEHHHGAHGQIVINAPAQIVWKSMHAQRDQDRDSLYCKVVRKDPNTVVEQKFIFHTVFGSAESVINLIETPAQRVDYKLTQSEDFKKMEGAWVLRPSSDGSTTTLELSLLVVPRGLPVPPFVVNHFMQKKVATLLAAVKAIAEGPQFVAEVQ